MWWLCVPFFYCIFDLFWVTERDEATTEASDHNATSFTEVDKRVKRRLLMGEKYTPKFIFFLRQINWNQMRLTAQFCAVRDRMLSCQEPLRGVNQGRGVMSSKPTHSSVFWANCEMTTRSLSRPQLPPGKICICDNVVHFTFSFHLGRVECESFLV